MSGGAQMLVCGLVLLLHAAREQRRRLGMNGADNTDLHRSSAVMEKDNLAAWYTEKALAPDGIHAGGTYNPRFLWDMILKDAYNKGKCLTIAGELGIRGTQQTELACRKCNGLRSRRAPPEQEDFYGSSINIDSDLIDQLSGGNHSAMIPISDAVKSRMAQLTQRHLHSHICTCNLEETRETPVMRHAVTIADNGLPRILMVAVSKHPDALAAHYRLEGGLDYTVDLIIEANGHRCAYILIGRIWCSSSHYTCRYLLQRGMQTVAYQHDSRANSGVAVPIGCKNTGACDLGDVQTARINSFKSAAAEWLTDRDSTGDLDACTTMCVYMRT